MSNGEKARKLLAESRYYRGLMEAALAEERWNSAVRHAQEAVELGLKGVLSYLLVDYPKVHDTGGFFIRTLAARGIAVSEQEAADVRTVSADLVKKRAPAFYFDSDEDESSATEAVANARQVHDLCLRIMADISGEEPGPRMPGPS